MANWGDTQIERERATSYSFRCRCALCECTNRLIGTPVSAVDDVCHQCRQNNHENSYYTPPRLP